MHINCNWCDISALLENLIININLIFDFKWKKNSRIVLLSVVIYMCNIVSNAFVSKLNDKSVQILQAKLIIKRCHSQKEKKHLFSQYLCLIIFNRIHKRIMFQFSISRRRKTSCMPVAWCYLIYMSVCHGMNEWQKTML